MTALYTKQPEQAKQFLPRLSFQEINKNGKIQESIVLLSRRSKPASLFLRSAIWKDEIQKFLVFHCLGTNIELCIALNNEYFVFESNYSKIGGGNGSEMPAVRESEHAALPHGRGSAACSV